MIDEALLAQINLLPSHRQQELLELVSLYEKSRSIANAMSSFHGYLEYVWPSFIASKFSREVSEAIDDVLSGKNKRLIINCPPRIGKSQIASLFLPSYYMGKNPSGNVIQATHTLQFSTEWGAKVRELVTSDRYQALFPGVELRQDKKAAGSWATTAGGSYYAVGVGGRMVGRNADLIVIDDPVTEQQGRLAAFNPRIFEPTYEWYLAGPLQRLMPHTAIILVMTRWGVHDLTGRIIKKFEESSDVVPWKIIKFPAIDDSGEPVVPERFPLQYWLERKAEYPVHYWNSVYQQSPGSDENALIKREWWRPWESSSLPSCKLLLQSWDTAYTAKTSSDYSACTTWGVFEEEMPGGKRRDCLILLHSFRDRMEFPALKGRVRALYDEWKPDVLLIEAKAAGAPLVHELRQMGIPVSDFTPVRGADKLTRVNAVADIFSSGIVYFVPGRDNEEVIEEFAVFPTGEHDDLVDTGTQALLRFRQGGMVKTVHDYYDEDEDSYRYREPARYY